MPYTLREHTADIAVEATADDCGSLFGSIADGLAAAMCESVPATGGDRFEVICRAESPTALLYEYLDQLIYERDVRLVLPVDNEATVSERDDAASFSTADSADSADSGSNQDDWVVSASARGVPLAEVSAREIKAVTYSEMELTRRNGDWYGYVVFDV